MAGVTVPVYTVGAIGRVSLVGVTDPECVSMVGVAGLAFTAGEDMAPASTVGAGAVMDPASMVGGIGLMELASTDGAAGATDLAFTAGVVGDMDLGFTAGADVDMGPAFTVGGAGADRAFTEPAPFIAALAGVAAKG